MRIVRIVRIVLAVAVMAWAGAACADLYRWVDRESGSIKYSSYPPPWYGDEAKQRRAPRVDMIPAGRDAVAKPGPPESKRDLRDASPEEEARRVEARKAPGKAARGEAK